jgi:hypothetical protein
LDTLSLHDALPIYHSPWNKEEYDQYAAIRTTTETTIAKRWLNSQ